LKFISTAMVAIPSGIVLFLLLVGSIYGSLGPHFWGFLLIFALLSAPMVLSGLALQARKPWAVKLSLVVFGLTAVGNFLNLMEGWGEAGTSAVYGLGVYGFVAVGGPLLAMAYLITSRRVRNTFQT
jgi:hypothetical protein